jgi:hypothetical protein
MVPNMYTSMGVPRRVIAEINETIMLKAVGSTPMPPSAEKFKSETYSSQNCSSTTYQEEIL